jgi:urease accessory protein
LGAGATLEYFPDHVIPHARSRLQQSLHLEMAAGSRAIVMDSMASGRVAHGERWGFTEMDSRTNVRMAGKPAFINRTKISPASDNPQHIGMMEEFDYMSCLGLFAEGLADWPGVVAALQAELDRAPQVRGGVSLLSRNGCVVRFIARSASDMICMNKKLWDIARELVLGMSPFDHRKY